MADQGNGFHQKAPARTTPQWSPAASVQHGYEGADVDIRGIAAWLGITAVVAIVAIGILYTVYAVWTNISTRTPRPASPLFAVQQTPPEPRILPNPFDSGPNPRATAPQHPESLPRWRIQEEEALKRYGLMDPRTGQPALPDRAVAAVLNRKTAVPAGGGSTRLMPSESSGGTRLENWLVSSR